MSNETRGLRQRLSVSLAISLVLVLGVPQSAHAARAREVQFVAMINDARATALLPELTLSERLCDIARKHSRRMAERSMVFHSRKAQSGSLVENVGSGPRLNALLQAFLASPVHAANILGSFTRTGVGIVRAKGQLWITQVFAT